MLLLRCFWHAFLEIFIIIAIKLSFLVCLDKKHLAQKRVIEESLVVINFEQVRLEVSFTKQ